MPKKPINYCLEMKYKVIQNGVCFTKESLYGVYTCVSKARKDIEEMQAYCLDKRYLYIGYRIFTLPSGLLVESAGKPFKVPVEMRVLQMTDNVVLSDNILIIKGENYYE